MSQWSDIKRALRPAELSDGEIRGLRESLRQALPKVGDRARVEIPSVTAAGRTYLLTVIVLGGRIDRFEVDLDPDLSSPVFEAYVDKRVEWSQQGGDRD